MADIVAQTCKEVFLNTYDGNTVAETDNLTNYNTQTDNGNMTLRLTEDNVAIAEQHTQQQTKRQRES